MDSARFQDFFTSCQPLTASAFVAAVDPSAGHAAQLVINQPAFDDNKP
jgi:hypothetical protein